MLAAPYMLGTQITLLCNIPTSLVVFTLLSHFLPIQNARLLSAIFIPFAKFFLTIIPEHFFIDRSFHCDSAACNNYGVLTPVSPGMICSVLVYIRSIKDPVKSVASLSQAL